MAKTKKYLHPVHPGEILLEEFLKPMGLTMHRLALDLHVPANRITQIVEGERALTADTALRLARYFGMTPDFWLGVQMQYDLEKAQEDLADQIDHEVQPRQVKSAA